jgi:hypothetical protein
VAALTETLKTKHGTFECEVIELDSLYPVSKDMLGTRPTEKDYDRLLTGNTLVYLDGKRVVAFLKSAFTELTKIEPGTESYNYWRWVSRDLHSDQRGLVGGKEIVTDTAFRLTNGQVAFFRQVAKGKVTTLDEVKEVLAANPGVSRTSLYSKKILDSGFVDRERVLELESTLRKKSTSEEVRVSAAAERDELRSGWFENWLETWLLADDKVKYAEESYKEFVSLQTRSNKVHSNVLGFMDRSARLPFGRLSSSTNKKYDLFVSQKDFYKQASNLYKDALPDEWKFINKVMKGCKDERYTLMGTNTFSTITINYNFPTYFHYDGNNNPRGVAVLTALTNESYEGEKFDGSHFVFPELRLAFDVRKGDFLVGDNCNLMHGQTEQVNKTDDAENIFFVFYARDGMAKLDDYESECCRREFIRFSQENYADRYQKNSAGKFSGVFPSMWVSDEWDEYRGKHCPNASRNNYWYTEN